MHDVFEISDDIFDNSRSFLGKRENKLVLYSKLFPKSLCFIKRKCNWIKCCQRKFSYFIQFALDAIDIFRLLYILLFHFHCYNIEKLIKDQTKPFLSLKSVKNKMN